MNTNFLEVLNKNDDNEMKKFLLSEGKKPKPHSPIYFVDMEDSEGGKESNGRKTNNGTVNE